MIAVTVDTVVFAKRRLEVDEGYAVLLVRRKNDPFKGQLALPGGFIDETDYGLSHAALRELAEETGLKLNAVCRWGAAGNDFRDPRGWTLTVIHSAQIEQEVEVEGKSDATEALWLPVSEVDEKIAFDHSAIIKTVLRDPRTWDAPLAQVL